MKKLYFEKSSLTARLLALTLFLVLGNSTAFAQDSWSGTISHGDDPPQIAQINERLLNGDTTFDGRISPTPGPLNMLIDVSRVVTMIRPDLQEVEQDQAVPSSWGQISDGSLDSNTAQTLISENIISPNASITIYIRYDSGNFKDSNKVFTVSGMSFNGQTIDSRVYYLRIGQWKKIVLKDKIPINLVKFGTWQGDTLGLKPQPGHNSLVINSNVQSVVTPDSEGFITSEVTPVALLDFGAVAPIVFVHGLGGDSQAWNRSGTYSVDCNNPTLTYTKWSNRSDVTGSTGYNFGGYDYRNIMDEFLGYPTNQTNGACTAPPAPYSTELPDRYRGPWSNQVSLGVYGQSGIAYDAGQLTSQLQGILDGFGAKRCHIVAHSKGGLDTRYFLDHDYQTALKKNGYEVLSLFTLATPHRGSLLAKALTNALMSATNDPDIQTALGSIALWKTFLGAGSGSSHWTEGVNDLIPENTISIVGDSTPTIHRFYNVSGDADIDGDGKILNIEAYGQIDNCPGGASDLNTDGGAMYHILRNCSNISVTPAGTGLVYGSKGYNDIEPVPGPPQPNDMLVQMNSALLSTSPSNLLPGLETFKRNHGNMKDQVIGQAILQQIVSDYPVKDYLAAPPRYDQ